MCVLLYVKLAAQLNSSTSTEELTRQDFYSVGPTHIVRRNIARPIYTRKTFFFFIIFVLFLILLFYEIRSKIKGKKK